MASATESNLLSALESPNAVGVLALFSDYLRPLSDLSNSKKSKNGTKYKQDQTTTIRSFAKQFLPFLNKSLSLLPKRLSKPKEGETADCIIRDLFDIYKLCLECLELLSSQLACRPYTVQMQRLRLIYCLEAWGLYDGAENEALKVLERLRRADSVSRKSNFKGKLLPNADNGDAEYGMVVVEVVAAIVKCVAVQQGKDGSKYAKVLGLMKEVRPWFRVLDANAYEKLHRVLVTHLGKCALFLVREAVHFGGDLACSFCVAALTEYLESSLKDQSYKFARQICSCLFSFEEREASQTIDIFICMLRTLACEFKAKVDGSKIEFIKLVSYSANKCRAIGTLSCSTIARRLNDIAGDVKVLPPLNLILRLYAAGLSYSLCDPKFKEGDVGSLRGTENESAMRVLLDGEGSRWHDLTNLLGSLENQFHTSCVENCTSTPVEHEHSTRRTWKSMDSSPEVFRSLPKKIKKAYLLHYLDAMKFVCQPLADLINSEKRQIVSEAEVASSSSSSHLSIIQDIFHQFCHGHLYLQRCVPQSEGCGTDYDKSILNVAVATFILAIRAQLKTKTSIHLVKQIIASGWIQPQGLKYLFASLYNIGVILYRNKRLEGALKALKLSHRASWTCVGVLCRMFANKCATFHNDLSEEAIADFVNEACGRSAFFLDVLQQCSSQKFKKFVLDSLESWSAAGNFVRSLPGPMPIVKQWVKNECKVHKNLDPADNFTTLYSLLSSSAKFSKTASGKILEQELFAYEEMYSQCPLLSCRMQVEVTDILLKDVYATEDDCLQKSRILIWKGRTLRTTGLEHLRDCIQCLTDAILLMDGIRDESNSPGILYHQLAVAYCLRASCVQEAEPNSKQILEDISAAMNLWLRIPIPDDCRGDALYDMQSDHTITMLYNTMDLLAVKGCTELHHGIYKLILRLAKWKNVQLEHCVAMLWACRRLNHALCASPIHEKFIPSLSEYCSEHSQSLDFWVSCLKSSRPLLIGFQQSFSFRLSYLPHTSHNGGSTFQSDIKVNDVKNAAAELLSCVPLPSWSAFTAGHLYYDLCEKLIPNGQLLEALSCAKEAHRLRTLMFQEKFKYSVEKQVEKYNDAGNMIHMRTYGLKNFQVLNRVAREVWPAEPVLKDINDFYLSPWNVLRCYLESILQVGTVNELIGNGSEAETFMLWGKSISCSQGLSLFTFAFCSNLGNIYRKRQLWELAEKELRSAKEVLVDSGKELTCLKCRLIFEVTLDKQVADLSRSLSGGEAGSIHKLGLSRPKDLLKAALQKLNHSMWKNCISCPAEASDDEIVIGNTCRRNTKSAAICSSRSLRNQDRLEPSAKYEPKATIDTRKNRKSKTTPKCSPMDKNMVSQHGSRLTRSKCQPLNKESIRTSTNTQISVLKKPCCGNASDSENTCDERKSLSEAENMMLNCCICDKRKCWHCFPEEVVQSGLLNNLICQKWELCRRRLLLGVLTSLGKCLRDCDQIHEEHEVILQSIFVLYTRNAFCYSYPSVMPLLDFIGKEFAGDVFAIERAEIIYSICWFALKDYGLKDARSFCCDLSHIQPPKVVSWLMLAFVLSREVPKLFQKVSTLLATLYLFSVSNADFVLPSFCNELSESHWASYFHQASLGTHISYRFIANFNERNRSQNLLDIEGSRASCLGYMEEENSDLLRLAPNCTQDLPKFVKEFFSRLPCSPVICISLLGGDFAGMLRELLHFPSSPRAWMLLSRLRLNRQPVVILLPVDSVLEDDDSTTSGEKIESKSSDKQWQCPWGSTVVDDVAPSFKPILEENYYSSVDSLSPDTQENRCLWWMKRKKLDQRLGNLLRNLEDSWLGPWRYVLLGEWLNCKVLDSVHNRLANVLKSKCKVDVHETLLKVILGGGMQGFEREACIAQFCLKNGCYVSGVRYFDEDVCKTPTTSANGSENRYGLALQLLREAAAELSQEDNVNREPILLVLDSEIQMLPWENIPILRKQEVYRMPSVGSISVMLNRLCPSQEQLQLYNISFPSIDPLDAFYLLNPGGDLSNTQVVFESWFRDKNLEGQAGSPPTAQELALALKSHDLFLYFGHGSGAQYISRHDIESLEKCAVTFLMGCSSGSLLLNGCYIPQGTPLSYLQAGSPVTVANLWEVTDKDIDRFGKAMLEAWLRERSSCSDGCPECSTVANEFAAMKLRGNTRKGTLRKKPNCIDTEGKCEHRRKIGSFMGDAREACSLPFLIGAAPVCYGVPTGIRTKKDSAL